MPMNTRHTNRDHPLPSNNLPPTMSHPEPADHGDHRSNASHLSTRNTSSEQDTLRNTVRMLQDRLAALEARSEARPSVVPVEEREDLIRLGEEEHGPEDEIRSVASSTSINRRPRHATRETEYHDGEDDHNSHDGGAKINKPEIFKGDARSVRDFLTTCEMYTDMQRRSYRPDYKRIIFAGSFFRDKAQAWWTTMYGLRPKPTWMYDWKEFCDEIHRVFGRTDLAEESARQLRNIRQTGSASEYYTRFLQLSVDAGWNDQATKSAFKEGLKNNVQLAIASMPVEPQSFVELADVAVRIDNQLHQQREKSLSRRNDNEAIVLNTERRIVKFRPGHQRPKPNSQPPSTSIDNTVSRSFTPRYPSPRLAPPSYGSRAPSRAPLSNEERDKRAREGRCFECGNQGHMASECPRRKTPFKRPVVHAITAKGEPTPGDSQALVKKSSR